MLNYPAKFTLRSPTLDQICIDVTENYLPPTENPPIRVDKAGLAQELDRRWKNGSKIRIRFINGSESLKERIKNAAETWLEHVNLTFEWISEGESDIRSYLTTGDGSWSYIGTGALKIPQNKPTMQFGWLSEDTSDVELNRVVIHELGHMLGFIHEHQNPKDNPIIWDKAEVYRRYRGAPNF